MDRFVKCGSLVWIGLKSVDRECGSVHEVWIVSVDRFDKCGSFSRPSLDTVVVGNVFQSNLGLLEPLLRNRNVFEKNIDRFDRVTTT